MQTTREHLGTWPTQPSSRPPAQRTPHALTTACHAQLRVGSCHGDVIIREACGVAERRAIAAFLYRIYIDELDVLEPQYLSRETGERRQLVDEFDHAPKTRYVAAFAADAIVACVRLVGEADGMLPFERHGFSVLGRSTRASAQLAREAGRFAVQPAYRGTGVFRDLARLAVHVCEHHDGATMLYLCCQRHLTRTYQRLGASVLGDFRNVEAREGQQDMTAMLLNLPTLALESVECPTCRKQHDEAL